MSWKRWLKRRDLFFCGPESLMRVARSWTSTRRFARSLWNWTRRCWVSLWVFLRLGSSLATRTFWLICSQSWTISGMFLGKRRQQMQKKIVIIWTFGCKTLEPWFDHIKIWLAEASVKASKVVRDAHGLKSLLKYHASSWDCMQIEDLECCKVLWRIKQHCIIPIFLFAKKHIWNVVGLFEEETTNNTGSFQILNLPKKHLECCRVVWRRNKQHCIIPNFLFEKKHIWNVVGLFEEETTNNTGSFQILNLPRKHLECCRVVWRNKQHCIIPNFSLQIEHLECARVVWRNKQHCIIPNSLFAKLDYGMWFHDLVEVPKGNL